MTDKKQVAKKENGELAKPSFMQGTGRGSENVGVEDLTIPRLELIQAISPQRDKRDPEYINGAEEGMFFNSVSKKLYGDELTVVPVYFRKEWIIWKSRKAGGGFFGAFASEELAEQSLVEQDLDPSVCEIVDSAQHFCLIVNDPTSEDPQIEEIVFSMSKSKMKASRNLNTMVRMAGGDRFERAYAVTSIVDQNKEGEKYMNVQLNQLGYVSEAVYRAAESVYEAVSSGTKDVNRDEA